MIYNVLYTLKKSSKDKIRNLTFQTMSSAHQLDRLKTTNLTGSQTSQGHSFLLYSITQSINNSINCYTYLRTILIYFAIITLASCGNRNPNLSEKQLLALLNDTTSNIIETPADILPDTGYIPPVGAKYIENRSIDPASPPVTLKVSISEGTKQTLKLSMFGSEIEYVTLRLPEENGYFASEIGATCNQVLITRFEAKNDGWRNTINSSLIRFSGNNIVVADMLGIRLFDNKGVFIKNLLLSEYDGHKSKNPDIIFNTFKQSVLRGIIGDRILLALHDHSSDEIFIGEYNIGNHLTDKSENEIIMTKVPKYVSGSFINNQTLIKTHFSINPQKYPIIAFSLNLQGDTLCKFMSHIELDKDIEPFAFSDQSFFYRFENKLFFRQAYCDTIFRVESANRIIPAYKFDFGDKRVSIEEGVTAKTEGKLLPHNLIHTKNSMILIFTEGRDSPSCRTEGEVTFHCLMFDKKTGRPTNIDLKSKYPEEVLIENDIDNGLPVQLLYLNTKNENIFTSFTKKQIESFLKEYEKKIPPEAVSKLKTQAEALKQNEILLMIIKN